MLYLELGQIGAAYGVKGWVKVQSYAKESSTLLQCRPWFLSTPKKEWEEVTVLEGRLHGKIIVVKIAGVDTPEQARLLTGRTVAVYRSHLPKLQDEYYWSDLIGLTVINMQEERLGQVVYLLETGSNDVLVVKDGKEYAIPYLKDKVIKKIDLEKKEIHVDWEKL